MAGVEPRVLRLSVCYKSRYQTSVVLIKVRTPSCMNHASTCFLSLFRGVKRDAATDLVVFINCKKKKKNKKKKNGETAVCTVPRLVAEECSFMCSLPGTARDTV